PNGGPSGLRAYACGCRISFKARSHNRSGLRSPIFASAMTLFADWSLSHNACIRAVVGDGSSLSPTVLWLRPVGDSSATLFSRKLVFAGSCAYLETIHSRDAQANLPGEKVATDGLDQLGQPAGIVSRGSAPSIRLSQGGRH